MKVAVYYPWVYLTSGVERTIVEMCRRSRHQYTIFTNHFEPENTFPEFRHLEVVRLPYIPVRRQLGPVMAAAMTIAFQKLDLRDYDALLVHSDGLGNLVLNRSKAIPTVCMCHTPLRAVYDPFYRARALSRFRGPGKLAYRALASMFAVVDRRMFSRYQFVVFNSQETLTRASAGGLLRNIDGRYGILHPGVDWHGFEPTWRYERYFLVAGRIMWTKNIEMAIEAFLRFKASVAADDDFRLVIAGRVDKKSEPYLDELRRSVGGRSDVEFVVSPSDDVLRRLYADCYSLVFPAFNEDWGIVPLEANAYGKATIAANRGGPAESQKHGVTGFLVPCDADEFATAMSRLAANQELARSMGMKARVASMSFDWEDFVGRFDSILEAATPGHETGVSMAQNKQHTAHTEHNTLMPSASRSFATGAE